MGPIWAHIPENSQKILGKSWEFLGTQSFIIVGNCTEIQNKYFYCPFVDPRWACPWPLAVSPRSSLKLAALQALLQLCSHAVGMEAGPSPRKFLPWIQRGPRIHSGNPWNFLGFFGNFRVYGPIWALYGPIWALMGPYGPIWGPYGPIWGPYAPIYPKIPKKS